MKEAQGATPFGVGGASMEERRQTVEERRQTVEKYEAILLFNQIWLQQFQQLKQLPLIDFDKLKGQMVEAVRRLHENYKTFDEATANALTQRLGARTELPNEGSIPDYPFSKYPNEYARVAHVLSKIDADAGEGDMENNDVMIIKTEDGVTMLVKKSD